MNLFKLVKKIVNLVFQFAMVLQFKQLKSRSIKTSSFKRNTFPCISQIEGTEAMIETAKIVLNWLNEHHIQVELLNLGGGFGIKYVEGDVSFPIEEGIAEITDAIKSESEKLNYDVPEIGIEPGRSIVGEAGITLYEVGTIKDIPEVNKYVSIDGGMVSY